MRDDDRLVYAALGPLAALLLGMLLIPFRDLTTASNFTFLFLVLTIVVAEFGGRWPAVATALVSALSLDFFLTQPYMRLEIQDKHDILAFAGLTVCGLVVAAFGSQRGERRVDLRRERRQRALLHEALAELDGAGATEFRAARLLDTFRAGLPLTGLALRDGANQLIHSTRGSPQNVPVTLLNPQNLLAADQSERDLAQHALPLPPDGGRVVLMVGGKQLGWLDLWGGSQVADREQRQTLADVARVTAALLATRYPSSA
jgi:K+-sensing histidine kinase KdpD